MTDTDKVLHTDDPDRPGNLTAEEYRAEYEAFRAAHPDSGLPLPADAYRHLPDDAA
jgi:hypothetical protein